MFTIVTASGKVKNRSSGQRIRGAGEAEEAGCGKREKKEKGEAEAAPFTVVMPERQLLDTKPFRAKRPLPAAAL